MVLDSSFATSFNNRAGIPSWLSSSFSWLHFEQFSLYKTGGHFWTKSCLTLGVKTCGREQRLKWLRKALSIEVKKPLKLEAVRPGSHLYWRDRREGPPSILRLGPSYTIAEDFSEWMVRFVREQLNHELFWCTVGVQRLQLSLPSGWIKVSF